MYLGAPFISILVQRFPNQRRYAQFIGLGLMVVALVSSSFATEVWHLIMTQGILYGIAGTLVYLWVSMPKRLRRIRNLFAAQRLYILMSGSSPRKGKSIRILIRTGYYVVEDTLSL